MKNITHPTLTIEVEARLAYHILDGLRRQKEYYKESLEKNKERGLKAFERADKNNITVIDQMIQTIKNQAIIQGDVI